MMWDIKRIILSTDGSEEAKQAYIPAFDIAGIKNAEIVAVYVMREGYIFWEVPSPDILVEIEKGEREYGERLLKEIEDRGKELGIRVRKRIEKGRPADTIVKIARDEKADLIVIGTRGRGGVRRIIGSVADGVIKSAPCPVLAVRKHDS